MRTFEQRQRDLACRRYDSDDQGRNEDGVTKSSAQHILSSKGGKAAAKIAIGELWSEVGRTGSGYLPTARLSAPLRVLQALETVGLIERATDGGTLPLTAEDYEIGANGRGHAIRFRLSDMGLKMAMKVNLAQGGEW